MPSKRLVPHPVATRSQRRRKITVLTFLTVVLILFAAIVVQHDRNQRAIAADRTRFEQADQDLQRLSDEIIKVTNPEKHTYIKSCQYLHREFADKPLVCQINFTVLYALSDANSANLETVKYRNKLKQDKNILYGGIESYPRTSIPSENRFGPLQPSDNYELMSELIDLKNASLHCSLSHMVYLSSNPPEFSDIYVTAGRYSLSTVISCRDGAKQQYYPLDR